MEKSKKYFGTDGIRGRVGESLINPEFVLKLGWAVGKVLANGHRKKVLIGKDTRISGYLLESALQAGLIAAGVDIHLSGPMPTPAIAYLTRTLRAQAGIVISASHNPYYDNGIKFFSSEGTKLPDELEFEIESYLEKPLETVTSEQLGKAHRVEDARGRYIEFCKSTIPSKLRLNGLKIVLDCAHGATYHVAPDIFLELGAEVISLGVDPNGFNINHNCGSTKPAILQEAVRQHKADLGIALDGDGDRVIMVDHQGEIVDGDELLFMIATDQYQRGILKQGVVGTVMSNFGLELAVKQLGLDFIRAQVGDRYVLSELYQRDWVLGGETSGHIVCLDKTTTGDGIISALQVLSVIHQQEKSLAELKKGMKKIPQVMLNVKTQNSDKILNHQKVKSAVKETESALNGSGRVLLRPSGTEPVIRVMIEGEDSGKIKTLAESVVNVIEEINREFQ